MSQADKHTVVIASVLKPVDDTRGYEKMGVTLAGSGLYDVHVLGSGEIPKDVSPDIQFHSLGSFPRISWSRWTASFRTISIIRRLRPAILIIGTHELLGAAMFAIFFLGSKVVYDVQENYFRNILHTNAFQLPLRWPLALYVRIKEIVCSRFLDRFLLAEKVYEHQLAFTSKRFIVIENKALIPVDFRKTEVRGIELLFSGTLAESTGVFEAIRLASLLHSEDETVRLHIIGHCPSPADRDRLNLEAKGKSYISLNGIGDVQPHTRIIEAISTASFGIVCYPYSPHTLGAIPTKVYEYLACRLPALVTDQWAPLFEPYQAAVVFGPAKSAKEIIDNMRTGNFYARQPNGVLWQDEARKLLVAVSQLTDGDS